MSKRIEYLKVVLPKTCKNFHGSHYWNEAYDLYNKHHQRKVRKGCSACCQTVLNWIRTAE